MVLCLPFLLNLRTATFSPVLQLPMSSCWSPSGCSVLLPSRGKCPARPAPELPAGSVMAGDWQEIAFLVSSFMVFVMASV